MGTTPGHIETKTYQLLEWIGKEVDRACARDGAEGQDVELVGNIAPLVIEAAASQNRRRCLTIVNAPVGLYIGWHYTGKPDAKFRVYVKVGDDPPKYSETTVPFMGHIEPPPIPFGTKYQFFIQAMDGELHQSEAAASEIYTPQDTFAPTVPAGLTGTLGASTVELSWERNTDERFQGYNVYRSVAGAPPEKIASLITAPVYSDAKVETGKTYRYTVSGVGMNGIESPQSAPFEITVQ